MSRSRVVHLRVDDRIACSSAYKIADVEWLPDVADVSCNNCQHTRAFVDAGGVKPHRRVPLFSRAASQIV